MDTPDESNSFAPTKKRAPMHAGGEPAEEAAWERTVARDIMVGRTIGEYVVKRRLGAGGMGIVYEGEQEQIGRRVAIKILRPDLVTRHGLLAEARAANMVRHRGIVDIYGFGELPGIGEYLIMEYLDGKALDVFLQERGRLPALEAIPILDEILAALEAAHMRGVVHRDLKPSNAYIVEGPGTDRYVKLLDFGLAKTMSVKGDLAHQTRVSSVVGTPHYMAPEQARGLPIGARTDLYALGIIAFELLTGDIPFNGTQPMEIAIKQVNDRPPPPSQFVEIAPALEQLILQLLEKDPQHRPASASAVRQTLKRIQAELIEAKRRPPQRASAIAPATEKITAFPALPKKIKAPSTVDDVAAAPKSKALLYGGVGAALVLIAVASFLISRSQRPVVVPDEPLVAVEQPPAKELEPAVITPEPDRPPGRAVAPPTVVTPPGPSAAEVAEELTGPPVAISERTTRTPPTKKEKKVAPVPVGTGELKVLVGYSLPADVYIDGEKATLKTTLDAGDHHITVQYQDFEPWLKTVRIRADQTTRIKLDLNEADKTLREAAP